MSATKYARCPRCRSTQLSIIETHEEFGRTDFGQHEVDGSHVYPASVFIFEPGDPVRVEGECADCGHIWTMRRVVSA